MQFIELNNDKSPKNKGKLDRVTYDSCDNLENAGVLFHIKRFTT